MKKIIYILLAFILSIPAVTNAATFSFSPSTGSYAPGKTFNVTVYVNPAPGETITTAKLSASFPSDLLEVSSFAIESGWIPLTQPGYDSIDNAGGKVIKTGGYTAKVQSQQKFGVLTFKTKGNGSAPLSTDVDSILLDASNVNKYVASSGATFSINAPVVTPEVATPPTNTVVQPTPSETDVNADTGDNQAEDSTTTQLGENELAPQPAAAVEANGGSIPAWAWALVIIVLLGIISYFTFYLPRRKN